MKLNKHNWEAVSFSEIATCVEQHDKSPLKSGINRFIGLEHIEPESLMVKSWGDIVNGTTFTKRFSIDDVLFGKRRAYLKKVAIADFEGICSSDILVFRAIKEKLIPGLLPYFVSSDRFIQHAISTSAGSLSPRTKWRDLAKYKLLLPPQPDQNKILSIFRNLESLIELNEKHEKKYRTLVIYMINDFLSEEPQFGELLLQQKLQSVKFKDIAIKINRKYDPINSEITRIIAGENLESEDLIIRTWGTIGEDFLGPAFHMLFQPGDILYGSRRTYLKKVSIADFPGVCANTTFVLRANEEFLMTGLLKYIMLSNRFTEFSIGVSKGSTNPYINWKDLDGFAFKIPDLDTQKLMVSILDNIILIAEQIREYRQTLKDLKQQLLNEILS